jgi:hypothetical protein
MAAVLVHALAGRIRHALVGRVARAARSETVGVRAQSSRRTKSVLRWSGGARNGRDGPLLRLLVAGDGRLKALVLLDLPTADRAPVDL